MNAINGTGSVLELQPFLGAGHLLYLANPQLTSFETPEDVPNFFRQQMLLIQESDSCTTVLQDSILDRLGYISNTFIGQGDTPRVTELQTLYNSWIAVTVATIISWPYFLAFILLENIILWLEGKPIIRLNDGLTSLSHGLFQECGRLVFRGAENAAYIYLYERWRLVDLPWDSPATWYLAALGVDFCYYWVHRACHEVHILWAQHQVHHSSEEFNMAVGLRQSVIQGWCGFIFYLPLSLLVPPAHFLTHQQFNLLYQFWIHTQAIKTLGPLEWILNTPNHHRVHHGCNIYCLDKNYGGVLIIWDRIFGTFAEEKEKETIIYGLVYNQPSFNPFHLQVFYNQHVIDKWQTMQGWQDKLAAVWKGPSWQPGKPRLGEDADKLDIRSRDKYDVKLPVWFNIYLLLHFIIVVIGFQELALRYMGMNPLVVFVFVCYILASLTTIGMLFDNSPNACILELARCLIFVGYVQQSGLHLMGGPRMALLQSFFMLSSCFWVLKALKILQIKGKLH